MNKLSVFVIFLLLLIFGMFYPIPFLTSSITGNYGDIYKHYYPLKHLIAEHIVAGKMPYWNPYIFAGQPLLANPQGAVFYPLSVLFCIFPLTSAFNLFIMLHFFLAGIFIFLFLKNNRLSNTASVLGTITFSFSGFMVSKVPAGHPAALSGYVWLPLIMLLSDRLSLKPAAYGIVVLSLAFTFQFLSGHTFPIFVTVLYLFLFLLFNFGKIVKPYAISVMGALLLSCVQFIPTYELSQVSETGNWLTLVQNYSLPFKNLINFVIPNYFGNVFDHTFQFPSSPSYFFEKHSLYMGILPLLLAAAGVLLMLKRKKFFYPVLLIAGIFISSGYNNPVYSFLYSHFPGFNYLRVPARFIYLTIISISLLSAYVWNELSAKMHTVVKLIIIAIVVIDIFHWGKQYIYPEDMDCYEQKSDLVGAFTPAGRILTEPDAINPDKSMLYHHYNLNGYEAIFLRDFTRYLGMQEKYVLNATGLDRTDLLSPLAAGFSVKYIVSTKQELNYKPVPDLAGVYETNNFIPRAYFPQRLKYISEDDIRSQLDYLKNTKFTPLQEIMVNSGIKAPDNYAPDARILSYGAVLDAVFIEAEAAAPSVMVLSDIFYTGWHAAAGKHKFNIFRAHKVFQGIYLPKGSYTGADRIVFYFLPGSFMLGMLITLLSVAALYVFLLKFFRKMSDEMCEVSTKLV